MNDYTIAPHGEIWQVMKDGRFFCTATGREMAEKIAGSLKGGRTPSVNEFTVSDLEESIPLPPNPRDA